MASSVFLKSVSMTPCSIRDSILRCASGRVVRPSIHQLVDDEDAARIEALCQFYRRFDYPMPQALIRARVLYFSQIGFYALGTSESLQTRLDYTEAYFEAFTGQHLTRQQADEFRDYILANYGGH